MNEHLTEPTGMGPNSNDAAGVLGMDAPSLNELLRIAHELRKLEDELDRGLQPRRDLEDFVRAHGVEDRKP